MIFIEQTFAGGRYEYRFILKIHMDIFTCTLLTWLFASTNLIQGVRFDQQVEVKARHCSVAAKVSVNYSVPDRVNEKDAM